MPVVLTPCGDRDEILRWRGLLDSGPVLSLAPGVHLHFPPPKRLRLSSSPILRRPEEDMSITKRTWTIDALPDECLLEILRRLDGKRERSLAACVSRRWLMLLGSGSKKDDPRSPLPDLNESPIAKVDVRPDLSRCLEGSDATDVRLAALAVASGGELGELSLRSCTAEACRATDLGLRAVARCCPALRTLTLWGASCIGDAGLLEIAEGCPILEKLDLCHCRAISDKGIAAIAESCPNLVSLTVESCPRVSDKALQAIGQCSTKLETISISSCPLVGDEGISALVSAAAPSLKKLKLQSLNITDVSLGVVGYYGKEVNELVLGDLHNTNERGFWVMGNTCGLQKLTTFTVSSCDGLTDLGLEAIAKGCPFLKQVVIRRSNRLSDTGMERFSQATRFLECFRLDECSQITMTGLMALVLNCHAKLRALSLSRCGKITSVPPCGFPVTSCDALRSLAIRDCAGMDDSSLALLSKFCPRLQELSLRGLSGVTDAGLVCLITHAEPGLEKVNLNGCDGASDEVVGILAKIHGGTLETLGLDGCRRITDYTLLAVAGSCSMLKNLDVSFSGITDAGIAALSLAKKMDLGVLSLAHCRRVSNRGLALLAGFGKSLIGLNLQNCPMVSPCSVGSLEEKLWWCDILY